MCIRDRQNIVVSRLHRQVQRRHQMRQFPVGRDQLLGEILRVRSHEAYALHAQGVYAGKQPRKLAAPAAIGIDVLPQQRDLLYAPVCLLYPSRCV